MATHLALLEEEFRRQGQSAKEARRSAQRKFGVLEKAQDFYRDARSIMCLERLLQDLRYTLRALIANKTYTATAVITFALGVGVTSALYSVIHPLIIEPLPYDRPEKLVRPYELALIGGGLRPVPWVLSPQRADEFVDASDSVAGVSYSRPLAATLTNFGNPVRMDGTGISEGTLPLLGAAPIMGRGFVAEDYRAGAEPVVILSFRAWRRYWQSDSGVVGQRAMLDMAGAKQAFRIVGVMEEGFRFAGPDADFWVPYEFDRIIPGLDFILLRVRDEYSLGAASAEVNSLIMAMNLDLHRLAPSEEELEGQPRVRLVSMVQSRRDAVIWTPMFVLVAMVVLVLLLACTNAANLMLGRGATRMRELAIRSSLGASRGRLVRQVFIEGGVLSLVGGVIGAIVAFGFVRFMTAWPGNARPGSTARFLELPRIDGIELDINVLAFALGVAVVSGLLCAIVPALAVERHAAITSIKDGSSSSSTPKSRGRNALIVCQVAFATVLLVGAGLLMQSFLKLTRVDPGFSTEGVLTFEVAPSSSFVAASQVQGQPVPYLEDLAIALRALPGVEAAGYAPQSPFRFASNTDVLGMEIPGTQTEPAVSFLSIFGRSGYGYLDALGARLLQGRAFSRSDAGSEPMPMIVNEAFVRQNLGDRDVVGLVVSLTNGITSWDAEIVGVIADFRQSGLHTAPKPQQFLPTFGLTAGAFFAVRTPKPEALATSIASLVAQFDPDAVVERIEPIDRVIADTILAPRFFAQLLATFSVFGVILACVGIYGVASYAVTRRTKEIGVRIAVGANRRQVLWLILRHGLALTLIGIAIGLISASAVGRYLSSLLFGIDVLDTATFLAVAALFSVIAMLATSVPARRATRIDPLVALRHD